LPAKTLVHFEEVEIKHFREEIPAKASQPSISGLCKSNQPSRIMKLCKCFISRFTQTNKLVKVAIRSLGHINMC